MFEGFSERTIDFLWGIRFNNNRAWFQAHKQEYEATLYRPMVALAEAVDSRFRLEGTRLKASRIYRDVRYAPVPYKDYLWFVIRDDSQFWSEHPSLFFQIEPEGGQYGFIHFAPKASLMAAHRRELLAHPDRFPGMMDSVLASGAFQDKSTRYKRPKEGEVPGLSPWYQMKNCYVGTDIPVGPELFSRDLPDRLAEAFRALTPLYQYFHALETQETP